MLPGELEVTRTTGYRHRSPLKHRFPLSAALLYDVHELVRQKPPPSRCVRGIMPRSEHHIPTYGIGQRIYCPR